MNEGKKPGPPSDFDARLADAVARRRAREEGGAKAPGADMRSGLGLALRIGVELVAALAVGAVMGYLLDQWLGTTPWLMVAFVFLGGAAGIFNVVRIAGGFGGTVGYRRGATPPPAARDDDDED